MADLPSIPAPSMSLGHSAGSAPLWGGEGALPPYRLPAFRQAQHDGPGERGPLEFHNLEDPEPVGGRGPGTPPQRFDSPLGHTREGAAGFTGEDTRGTHPVAIIGAGVAGLTTAVALAERGLVVTLYEQAESLGGKAASWLAGGMLAPHCEAEKADAAIVVPGLAAIDWWASRVPGVERRGTLVVALSRDADEVQRFARRTTGGQMLDAASLGTLEPDLAGRFSNGLFFADEAHLDPRAALQALAEKLVAFGGTMALGNAVDPEAVWADFGGRIIDCRGSSASDPQLRLVRGEMLILRAPAVSLSRPVRMLHPRYPIYVVPRGRGLFMLGATEIESASTGAITVRSAMDLLNAAVALHPAFGEAQIVETGAGLRPAFPDNLPRISKSKSGIAVNGLYRHGFLLSPAFAEEVAARVMTGFGRGRAST